MTPMNLLKVKEETKPEPNKVNEDQKSPLRPQKPSHPWRRVIIVFVLALVVFAGSFGYKVYSVGNQITGGSEQGDTFLGQLKTLIIPPEKALKGEDEGRINVLLLGFGGSGHQGAYLTDTMIVASFNPVTNKVAMLSIPRDLFVEIPGYGYRKINNAYAFGRQEDVPEGGENLTQATVQQTLGIPIHYYSWVDFTGFEKIVDDIGGIDIEVDQAFVDYSYPTEDFGYQTIRFDAGTQHMDGETALKFVRSRKGTNGEGSDFARSKRQQKVILAVKEKLLGFGTLANPKRVSDVLDDLATHMKTNFEIWEMLKLARMYENISSENVTTHVLDNGEDGFLKTGYSVDGAYILQPKDGDFTEIQYFAQNIFEYSAINKEDAAIAVLNGTKKSGFARSVADELEDEKYDIEAVDNASLHLTTIIYDTSGGLFPETVSSLQTRFGGRVETVVPEDVQTTLSGTDPDIIILLGEDAIPRDITGGPVT